jgi:AcrR family transcriptional regulator
LASSLNCSLRTLYAIAPSRDELVVLVIDRNLRGFGRRALASVTPDMTPLEAIRAYLATATAAVHRTSEQFARDLQEVPAATASHSGHNDYLVAVTQSLLDLAVDRGEIDPVDTYALARVMASLGWDFAEPDVLARLDRSPMDTAGQVLDVLLRGLSNDR